MTSGHDHPIYSLLQDWLVAFCGNIAKSCPARRVSQAPGSRRANFRM